MDLGLSWVVNNISPVVILFLAIILTVQFGLSFSGGGHKISTFFFTLTLVSLICKASYHTEWYAKNGLLLSPRCSSVGTAVEG